MTTPAGFATVTPYFTASDAEGFIAFLVEGFGGRELGRTFHGNRLANAQVLLGNATVMVGQAPPGEVASKGHYLLYVEDADRAMERAVAAGAEKMMDVDDRPYGDRQGGVFDGEGNSWWISQRLTDKPYY